MPDRQVKVLVSAQVNGYLAGMDQVARKTKDVTKVTAEQSAALKNLQSTGAIALTAIGVAAAGMATLAIAKFAQFDQAMSFVDAATHETAENMGLLRDAALEAGAKTVFSATEAANAIEELGKAGVSTKDILAGGLDGALDLAAAGGLGVADAAGIAATALKQFELNGTDMAHVADLLAAGAGKAMGSVQDLSQGLKFVGPVAHGMGVSIDETVGVLAQFASQGILADQAGTGLRGVLMALTSPSNLAKKELDALGVTLYDGQGKFLGLANMAGELEQAYGGMTDAQKDASLGTIFGNQQITTARILLDKGRKGVEDWTKAVDDQGFAADTAARRLDNLKGDIEQLGGAFDTALIKMGSAADGVLRGLVQTVTDAVTAFGDLPSWVQGTTLVVVGLTGAVGLLGGAFLFLLPKVMETSAALVVLSTSSIPGVAVAATRLIVSVKAAGVALGATAKLLVGPWGIAMLAAVGGVELLTNWLESLRSSSDEVQKSLKTANDAAEIFKVIGKGRDVSAWRDITADLNNMSEMLDKVKAHEGNIFDLFNSSTFGFTNALFDAGTELANLAGTDLPAAQHAFSLMAAETDGSKGQLEMLLTKMGPYRDALLDVAAAQDIDMSKMTEAQKTRVLLKLATEQGTEATEDNSGALAELAGKAQDANGDIADLADTINNFGKGALDVSSATRGFEQAIDDASAAVEKNGKTLDVTSEKGRDNADAADNIAKATLAMASSQSTAGASAETLMATMQRGRDEFIKSRVAAGDTQEAAENLADAYGLIPENISTAIAVNTDPATRELDAWLKANANHRVHIQSVVDGRSSGSGLTFAGGGEIPGTPSLRDNMLIGAASGEFMVRTAQAQIPDNKRALHYMNNGGVIHGYASGGEIGFTPAPVYTPAPPRQQFMQAPGMGSGVFELGPKSLSAIRNLGTSGGVAVLASSPAELARYVAAGQKLNSSSGGN